MKIHCYIEFGRPWVKLDPRSLVIETALVQDFNNPGYTQAIIGKIKKHKKEALGAFEVGGNGINVKFQPTSVEFDCEYDETWKANINLDTFLKILEEWIKFLEDRQERVITIEE